jgi:hypothetical protein
MNPFTVGNGNHRDDGMQRDLGNGDRSAPRPSFDGSQFNPINPGRVLIIGAEASCRTRSRCAFAGYGDPARPIGSARGRASRAPGFSEGLDGHENRLRTMLALKV